MMRFFQGTGPYFLGIAVLVICGMGYIIHQNQNEIRLLSEKPPVVQVAPVPVVPVVSAPAHDDQIKALENEVGISFSVIAKRIIASEGTRRVPYLDSGGNVTIGDGRNLTSNGISIVELETIQGAVDYRDVLKRGEASGGRIRIKTLSHAQAIFKKPLTDSDITLLLVDDLRNVEKEARSVFPEVWGQINEVRKLAIIDVLYNLGLPKFKKFHKFIGAVKSQNWREAALELLLSEAARENILRYHTNALQIQEGTR